MSGKVAVVTGGASGVGAAVAEQLLDEGCTVHILDVQPAAIAGANFTQCDLADRTSIDAAIAALSGRIDTLVNVAGIADAEPKDKVLRVNILGLRHLSEALLPRIVDGGSVVIVASTAGNDWQRRADIVTGLLETPDFESGLAWCAENESLWVKDPYTFSKQCAVAYTYRAAGLAIDRRVRVNAVSPGAVGTPLSTEFKRLMGDAQYEWSIARVGRESEPAEIAEVVCYLAIGKCGWLNGTNIVVDGGGTAGILGGWVDVTQSPIAKARAAKKAAARG